MSFQAMAWACEQQLPCTQKMVLMMLANRTNSDTGKCIPKVKNLAFDSGIAESTCKLALRALEEAGFIKVIPRYVDGKQTSNQYELMNQFRAPIMENKAPTITPVRGQQIATEPGSFKPVINQNTSVSKADPANQCPVEKIIEVYHETLPELPKVRLMTAKREKGLKKVWSWVMTSSKADKTRRAETPEQALQWFRQYFTRVRDNDFLMGRGIRSAEHRGWKCTIDFLMTDRGMTHVIENTGSGQ